ncbi:chymotrypsin-2-like [Pseudomyrmex gracilis]|uniref:chymotrypsin-2-like n=1 Tax=Pseudomyrmex gracilis TaxID=219809 RepID=UPI000995CA2C|nr:chymotrypsin-2-like [Pseudomyrmex gracilis]
MFRLASILVFVAVSVVSAQTTLNDADVDISDHPYVVSITRRGKHVCSGAIIDAYNIVTSDRCVPPFKHVWNIMNDIVVVSGTSSIKPGGGVRIFAKEMFSQNHQNHENPNENHVSSGLGLIKLVQALKFGDKVQPIPISEAEVPVGEKLQMVGWMISNHQGNKTSNLKEVAVETISSEDCQSFYDKTLSNAEFCTLPVPENNLCEGDSGSPLIYDGKLVGLATYGISCEDISIPDVHTAVNKNLEFLLGEKNIM